MPRCSPPMNCLFRKRHALDPYFNEYNILPFIYGHWLQTREQKNLISRFTLSLWLNAKKGYWFNGRDNFNYYGSFHLHTSGIKQILSWTRTHAFWWVWSCSNMLVTTIDKINGQTHYLQRLIQNSNDSIF